MSCSMKSVSFLGCGRRLVSGTKKDKKTQTTSTSVASTELVFERRCGFCTPCFPAEIVSQLWGMRTWLLLTFSHTVFMHFSVARHRFEAIPLDVFTVWFLWLCHYEYKMAIFPKLKQDSGCSLLIRSIFRSEQVLLLVCTGGCAGFGSVVAYIWPA